MLLHCASAVNSPAQSGANSSQATERLPQARAALAVPPPTGPAAAAVNPFTLGSQYINPKYVDKLRQSAAHNPDYAEMIAKVETFPTALWLDSIESVAGVPEVLRDAQEQGKQRGEPVVPVFIVYNLPNRDCAAKASSGELRLNENGEQRYREEMIDALAKRIAQYPKQPVVAILEPDSLPNLVSNLGVAKCSESQLAYKHSVAYAIAKLSSPNTHIYLDAAHAGWLGWEGNRRKMAKIFAEVLSLAGGADRIRGFATNVSNYNGLDGRWGKELEASTPTPNEYSYVQGLSDSLQQEGLPTMGFLIDTSRNGRSGLRSRWGNWCNIRGAGLGQRPQVAPRPLVDAYVWAKPPGESDGIADSSADRFDDNCASPDATPNAPEAGDWFDSYFVDLVKNADPAL